MSQPLELLLPSPLPNGLVVLRTKVIETPGMPSRQQEHTESRAALSTAMKNLGLPTDLSEVEFEGHQKIIGLRDLRFSISHTGRAFGCWALRDPNDAYGIGFDIERNDRILTPAAISRVVSADDIKSFSPLQIWCAKEAAFKSLPSDAQASVTLPQIRIGTSMSFNVDSIGIIGTFALNLLVPDLTLALAWINLN